MKISGSSQNIIQNPKILCNSSLMKTNSNFGGKITSQVMVIQNTFKITINLHTIATLNYD
jgi:hypothetical protein